MSKRKIITDRDITDAWKKGSKTIDIDPDTIITPSAKDSAKVKNIIFVPKSSPSNPVNSSSEKIRWNLIAVGCDHAGFRLKEILKKFLAEKNIGILDLGTHSEEPCDYPDFAFAVSMAVKQEKAEIGIIIDGVGAASAMVANKIPGIRAACCSDEFSARSSREHNNANVLTLGSRVVGEELAKSVLSSFLNAKFLEGRHIKRLEKIKDIENKFVK